jgi:hypothetical protein
MIDPRFSYTGAAPFVPGYGTQQPSAHRHRHHRQRKSKHRNIGGSPMSRDESIHKVNHAQQQYFPQSKTLNMRFH